MNRQYARNALLAGGLALAMGCCRSEPISGMFEDRIGYDRLIVHAVDGKEYEVTIEFGYCQGASGPSQSLLVRAAQHASSESRNPIVAISRPYNVHCIGNLCEAETCSSDISFSTPESVDPKKKS